MNVFDLYAKLSLDSSSYENGLSKAKTAASTAAKVGGAALVALGTAAVAGTKSLVDNTKAVAAHGDEIDKMSQKIGISAKAYQEWDFILQHNGASISTLRASMKTLSNAAQNNNEAFKKLGITENELATLNQEELFARTISALQGMEAGTERTYLASKLLGRGSIELGALLNQSAEETEKMRQSVHDLGGVMSDDAVKASARFQDSLQDAKTAIEGVKNKLLGELLPSFADVMDGFSALVSGSDETGEKLKEGINKAIEEITRVLPKVLEVGGKILMAIVDGIVNNLPAILEAARTLILQLVNGIMSELPKLLEMLPEFVEIGLQLIISIIQGIVEALPELVPAIINAMVLIVQTIIDNLPMIIEAAGQIIKGIAEGLSNSSPVLKPIAALLNGIGDIIMFVADNLDYIIPIIEVLIGLLVAWKVAQIALNIAMTANPIGLIIMAIGALIAAIVLLIEHFDEIVAWLDGALADVGAFLVEMFNSIGEFFTNVWNALTEWVSNIATTIYNFFKNIFNSVKEWLANLGNSIKEWFLGIIDRVGEWIAGIFDAIGDFFSRAWELGKSLVEGIWEGIKDGAIWLWEKITGWLSDIWEGIKDFFGVASPSKKMEWLWEMNIQGGINGLIKKGKDAVKAAKQVSGDISDALAVDSELDLAVASSGDYDDFGAYGDDYEEMVVARDNQGAERDITIVLELDGTQLARTIYRMNNEENQRVGLRLAGAFE